MTWDGDSWGGDSPPAVSAAEYRTYRTLAEHLADTAVDTALDVGCGYGRITPWIDEFARRTHGIDPNADALGLATDNYPEVAFGRAVGQALPFREGVFDLIVTWTTLQHVPPERLDPVVREIERVLAPGGTLLMVERTESTAPGNRRAWGRSVTEYAALFGALRLTDAGRRWRPDERASQRRRLMTFVDD